MKKAILILLLAISTAAYSQKKDTIIAVTLTLDQYKALLSAIDANIDSKKVSKEVIEFIQKNAKMVADKPKEVVKESKQ